MPVTTDLLITKAWSGNSTSLEVAQPELALLDATQCALRWCLQSASHQLCYWLQQSLVKNFLGFQDKLPTTFSGN
ncbi:hypothetical protein DVH05_003199 [Phytophthora capsici]|nr:hypothetical protein DVH05_003199 [Phytophthora capsici]